MKTKHKIAYMKCAVAFAECSPAKRLQVGCVIVKNNRIISCGYNALPAHINGNCETEDGTTDPRVRHAEDNALSGLIKSNENSVGASLFCTHSCCEYCAIKIIDAGIKEFYYVLEYRCDKGLQMLMKAGIVVAQLDNTSDELYFKEKNNDSSKNSI